jgi:hypothetical protein
VAEQQRIVAKVDELMRRCDELEERHRADVILDFGLRKVLVETKFVRDGRNVQKVIEDAVKQVDQLRKASDIQQACVITFVKRTTVEIPDRV